MNINNLSAAAIAVIATVSASQAGATVFTYDLTDTPHRNFQDGGFYKFAGGPNRFYETYSFEQKGADVKLRFDDATGTAQINGRGYNLETGLLSDFNLFYSEASLDGNKLTLRDMDTVGAVDGTTVFGKGFNLTLLGDSLTGHGWLNNRDGTHFGDFHLAGAKTPNGGCAGAGCGGQVPVPAPLTLIGAMALFGAWRRRRSTEG